MGGHQCKSQTGVFSCIKKMCLPNTVDGPHTNICPYISTDDLYVIVLLFLEEIVFGDYLMKMKIRVGLTKIIYMYIEFTNDLAYCLLERRDGYTMDESTGLLFEMKLCSIFDDLSVTLNTKANSDNKFFRSFCYLLLEG